MFATFDQAPVSGLQISALALFSPQPSSPPATSTSPPFSSAAPNACRGADMLPAGDQVAAFGS